MDVFQTIASGISLIYGFLNSYTSASEQSRSLAARLNWDLRVIRQFIDHYESRLKGGNSLSPGDQELLDSSAAYLAGLAAKVMAIAQSLQSRGRLRRELNKALWWHREEEVRRLEEELFEWTARLDLRLVGLPSELTTVIKLEDQAAANAPNFTASQNIQSVMAMTEKAGRAAVDDSDGIFREDTGALSFVGAISPKHHERFEAVEDGGRQFLIERRFHEHRKGSTEWEELKSGLMRLAGALHCLDGTTVNLLRCEYLFHDVRNPVMPNFAFVNSLPFPVNPGCPTLKSLIAMTQGNIRLPANHSLSERLTLAQSLATTVFFLHSVRFLHHTITSHNVVMLHRREAPSEKKFPYSLGTPFLVGFEAVKEFHTLSDQREAADAAKLYQHPDRLLEAGRPKYGPVHDIFSLGMVLLEVGMWRPLERYRAELLDPVERSPRVSELLRLLNVSMGSRFGKVVAWCLNLETGANVESPARFLREVLEPLEEMASSMR